MFPGHPNGSAAPTCVARTCLHPRAFLPAPVGNAGTGAKARTVVKQAQVRLLECRRETQGEVLKLRLTACLIASTLMRTKRLFSALANKPSASSGQGLRVLPRVALIWIHTLRPARASQRSPASQSSIGRGLRLTGVGQSPVIERRYL